MSATEQPSIAAELRLPHLGVGEIRSISAHALEVNFRSGTACGEDHPVELVTHHLAEVRCPPCLAAVTSKTVRGGVS